MSEDVVEVVDGAGVNHALTVLERHVLYCLDEGRPIAVRYNVKAVGNALAALNEQRLVYGSLDGLTPAGLDVVERLRLRHATQNVDNSS